MLNDFLYSATKGALDLGAVLIMLFVREPSDRWDKFAADLDELSKLIKA